MGRLLLSTALGAGKWILARGAAGVAVVGGVLGTGALANKFFPDQVSNIADGTSKFGQRVAEEIAEAKSDADVRAVTVESFGAARGGFMQKVAGFFSSIFAFLHQMTGNEKFAEWEKKLNDFHLSEVRELDDRAEKIQNEKKFDNNPNQGATPISTEAKVGLGAAALGGTALAARTMMSSGKEKVAEAAVEGGVGAATKAATESPILNSAGKPFVHAAEEVAEGAAVAATKVGRFKSLLGKIPVIGKYLGVAAVVGGTATAIMTPGSAQASVTSEEEGSITTTKGAVNEAGVELASIGASALAATPAAAVFAGKQIPGFGAVFAAGDAIYGTVKHALRGDFDKAGTRFVAGVGETVAGLGGFTTYATVGSAWRELVREGGQKLFGEDRAIDHSFVGQAALLAKDFATAKDNDRTRDNTEQQPVAQYGVNPLWQPLGFASGPV